MNQTQADRLATWAYNIGELEKEQLNMLMWVCERGDKNFCGTVACAAGWLPWIFPEEWEFNPELPTLKNGMPGIVVGVRSFFGLSIDEIGNILYISSYNTYRPKPRAVKRRMLSVLRKCGYEPTEEKSNG